jgi:hypothetical protein
MKKKFTLMIAAAIAFTACSKDDDSDDKKMPPHAASTQTWTFGERIWSDAIHMPDCNKEDFDGETPDAPKPDGRSYTSGGKTYYYYSWLYVDAHKATMCPLPWRVPTSQDFDNFTSSPEELMAAWGLSGYADGSSIRNHGRISYYWLDDDDDFLHAFRFGYGEDTMVEIEYSYGFQVRCVK